MSRRIKTDALVRVLSFHAGSASAFVTVNTQAIRDALRLIVQIPSERMIREPIYFGSAFRAITDGRAAIGLPEGEK